MTETRPILIVGAGPTGMTAALELANFGIPVRIIDKFSHPADTSRAIAVQSRTLELMHQRGLADGMLNLGNRAFATTLYEDARMLGEVDFSHIDSRFNFVLLLSQYETERILREHLEQAGVLIECETELVEFSQSEGFSSGVKATLSKVGGNAEVVEAAYLIDAEGAHSVIRRDMELAFDGKSLPNNYVLADVYVDGELPEDKLSIFIPQSGLLAAFPMGNRRFRIIATEKHPVSKDAETPNLEYIRAVWAQGSHIPVQFRDLQWSSRFRINSRALGQLRHGRIFFGGDSAHVHSPAGGQGMNTGIQDMINLCWKLSAVYRGHAADALLETYNEERLPIIHKLLARTERGTDIANSDSHFLHLVLQHVLPFALSFDAVRRTGADFVSELTVNYRESSLNCKRCGDGRLHPGDRFPDIAAEDGKTKKTLDFLVPSRFTILSLGNADIADFSYLKEYSHLFARKHIAVPSDALIRALDGATVAIVRPDGYLLCAGDPDFVSGQLIEWFRRWHFVR